MPRHERRIDVDLGYADGHIFLPVKAADITTGAGATEVATYNSITTGVATSLATAATAYTATVPIGPSIYRYGLQDDLQQQFGSARAGGASGLPTGWPTTLSTSTVTAGTPTSIPVLSSVNFFVGQFILVDVVASGVQEFTQIVAIADGTHISANLVNGHTTPFIITGNPFTTPAGVSGSPPYTGFSEFSSVVVPRPKGISFKQITPVYAILTAAATVNTIGLVSTTFNNVAATTSVNIIAVAANGLQTATNAASQAYVTPIPVPVAQQGFQIARNTQYVIQWNITTGAAATAAMFGVWIDVVYNYN